MTSHLDIAVSSRRASTMFRSLAPIGLSQLECERQFSASHAKGKRCGVTSSHLSAHEP